MPLSLFGLHILNLRLPGVADTYGTLPPPPDSFTYGTLRLHDAGVSWAVVEPSQGVYDWSRLDAYVALSQQRGFDLMLTVDDTPQWASSAPNRGNCSFLGNGGCAMPSNLQDYVDFLTVLATRYTGKIKYYEGWNEANSGWDAPGARTVRNLPSFIGTNFDLVTLQQTLSQTVKNIDHAAQIVSPSFTGGQQGIDDVNTLLSTPGACQSFDILGFHFYTQGAPPEAIPALAQQLQTALTTNGCGVKPIHCTETGWDQPSSFPDINAPAYLARAYILAWNAGVQRFYWYAFNDSGFAVFFLNDPGLLAGDTPEIRLDAPGWAFTKLQTWIVGKTIESCSQDANGFYTCNLTSPGSSTYRIVWYSSSSVRGDTVSLPFSVPSSWQVESAEDINGNVLTLGSSVLIGPAPVLFSPQPASGSEVSAASYNPDFHSADSLVTAFGSKLATTTAQATKLATTLAGTSIDVLDANGVHTAATPIYVSPGQVNYWLPPGIASGAATVTITNGAGYSSSSALRVTGVAPAIFVQGDNLQGPPAAFVDYVNGSSSNIKPAYACAGQTCSPVPIDLNQASNVVLELYATGVRNSYQYVAVVIAGHEYSVDFAGAQTQYVGLDQVNITLPGSLTGSGKVPLQLVVDTQISNTVIIHIQ